MDQLKIEYLDIDTIKPYKKNPRNNDKAIDYIKKSIEEFGFKNPILLDKNNVIIAGHTRYEASKKIGLKQVPCIIVNNLNEEQIKAFRIVDNKSSEIATWNNEKMIEEIKSIDVNQLEKFDIEQIDFDFSREKLIEPQDEEEIICYECPNCHKLIAEGDII